MYSYGVCSDDADSRRHAVRAASGPRLVLDGGGQHAVGWRAGEPVPRAAQLQRQPEPARQPEAAAVQGERYDRSDRLAGAPHRLVRGPPRAPQRRRACAQLAARLVPRHIRRSRTRTPIQQTHAYPLKITHAS